MKTSDIVRNGEILIPKYEWKQLNETHTQEEVKQLISDAIDEYEIPMPMRNISEQDAMKDFQLLCDFSDEDIIIKSPFDTRYDYKYHKDDMLVKSLNVGNKASDYFQQEARWMCGHRKYPSPHRSWYIHKIRDTLLNALWSMKCEEVNRDVLRTIIGLRKYIAAQFRPSSAKAIYNHFQSENVLDFSSGWGDRLCGFYASKAKTYTGIDPNDNVHPGYIKQAEAYTEWNSFLGGNSLFEIEGDDKTSFIHHGCAEEVELDGKFDTVFTSPPYFDSERYNTDDTQSWKRYKKFDAWMNDFLCVTLNKCWEHLEKGGVMMVNISDAYATRQYDDSLRSCDMMNDFIATLDGAQYEGCWGYEMRKRPNSEFLKDMNNPFAEPIWIWRKK